MSDYTDLFLDSTSQAQLNTAYAFPIAVYQSNLAQKRLGYVTFHWHEEIQYCCVLSGRIRILIGAHEYTANAGEGFFINTNQLHSIRPLHEKNGDNRYICLDIHPKLLYLFPESILAEKYIFPILHDPNIPFIKFSPHILWQRKVLTIIKKIYAVYEKQSSGFEFDIMRLLLLLWKFFFLNQGAFEKPFPSWQIHYQPQIKMILTYIHVHYAEKISLTDLSHAIFLSESECCRVFKRYLHCTIFEYIIEYRLNQSMLLLISTTKTINTISYETGFSNARYYILRFKEKLGITPREYRRIMISKRNS